MDIIIDSNILYKDPRLVSPKSQALLDYARKTKSHVVIPTIVRQEVIANMRRELTESLNQADNLMRRIDHWRFEKGSSLQKNIDVDFEIDLYEKYIDDLIHGGVLLELPYKDEFLSQVVERLANRTKPASEKGEEFRDVVLWLSLKEYSRASDKEIIFISEDKHFYDVGSNYLHPQLATELQDEGLKVKYLGSIDEFISQHSSKIDYINREWIESALRAANFERLATRKIESLQRLWSYYPFIEGYVPTGLVLADFRFSKVKDYYVYELENDELFLHATCHGGVSVDIGVENGRDTIEVYSGVLVDAECKVRDQAIVDLSAHIRGFDRKEIDAQWKGPDFSRLRQRRTLSES
jgi:predicted nucleic acid-binding protein